MNISLESIWSDTVAVVVFLVPTLALFIVASAVGVSLGARRFYVRCVR